MMWSESTHCHLQVKAAIDSITRSLALEWGEFGIRTNGIAPGPIADTPGPAKLATGSMSTTQKTAMEAPLKRIGTKFDVGGPTPN